MKNSIKLRKTKVRKEAVKKLAILVETNAWTTRVKSRQVMEPRRLGGPFIGREGKKNRTDLWHCGTCPVLFLFYLSINQLLQPVSRLSSANFFFFQICFLKPPAVENVVFIFLPPNFTDFYPAQCRLLQELRLLIFELRHGTRDTGFPFDTQAKESLHLSPFESDIRMTIFIIHRFIS